MWVRTHQRKMEEVKLLGTWSSPLSYRVRWALALKAIPYEFIEEDLTNKSSLLLALNPVHKKVPVLIHGRKVICESLVILEYIDETWPQNPLLSSDPYEKAVARFWSHFVDQDHANTFRKFFAGEGEEKVEATKKCLDILSSIERHAFVGTNKFLGGENVGLADLAMGQMTLWLEVVEEIVEVKLAKPSLFPRFHAWIQDFKGVPEVRENLPDRDRLVSSFRERREVILASK